MKSGRKKSGTATKWCSRLDTDTVQSLSWEYDVRTLAFHKEDDGWQYDDDAEFPVDEDKIQEMLSRFAEFGVSFINRGTGRTWDSMVWTIRSAPSRLRLRTKRMISCWAITVRWMKERYVSIGDGNGYLAANDPLDYFRRPAAAR